MIPRNDELSNDSKAILLLCSDLIKCNDAKKFNVGEWRALAQKIAKSEMVSPKAFLELDSSKWKQTLDISDEMIKRIEKRLSYRVQLGLELERLSNRGIWVITRAEQIYPKILRSKFKGKSPTILYGSGDISILDNINLGVVGSRDIEDEEVEFIEKLVNNAVAQKLTIVSGGSRGTDLVAENTAINNGGKVVSILSEDMEKIIMNKYVRNTVLNGNRLILSPYNPKSHFAAYNALDRNKYIYALSNYVVVVSALENKGGTWKGAIENSELKLAPMFIKYSEIKSGNKKLIKMGNRVIDSRILNQKDILGWLEENSSLQAKQENTQILIDEVFALNKNEKNTVTKEEIVNEESVNKGHVEFRQEKDKLGVNEKLLDIINEETIFNLVWPVIEKEIEDMKSIRDMCKKLNIRESQLKDWLQIGEEKGSIQKVNDKTRRYVKINNI